MAPRSRDRGVRRNHAHPQKATPVQQALELRGSQQESPAEAARRVWGGGQTMVNRRHVLAATATAPSTGSTETHKDATVLSMARLGFDK